MDRFCLTNILQTLVPIEHVIQFAFNHTKKIAFSQFKIRDSLKKNFPISQKV